MHKIIWDEAYTERRNPYIPQIPEWKKYGRIDGMKVLTIVKTNIDREGLRYRLRKPGDSIENDYTFTETEKDAMEKSEALLNKNFEQMFIMPPANFGGSHRRL